MNDKYTFSDNAQINTTLNQVVKRISALVEDQKEHIERLRFIGVALTQETKLNKVFNLILSEAIQYTNADGATIYAVTPDKKSLAFQLVYNRTLELELDEGREPITWPPVALYDENGQPRLLNMVAYVYHTGKSLSLEDVYDQTLFDYSGTRATDERNNYRSKSMLAIPLKNHEDEVLGVIQLINAQKDKSNKIIPFTKEHLTMMQSLASQAAITLSNKKLIADLEGLLRQFIQAIATAIDKKSKYTGGHITRMATFTEMIAQKIDETTEGKYANVHFSPDQLQEISIAGWMHDVGKIITPEYIMDKATKLETIFDRIELVKTRFDLMKAVIQGDIREARWNNNHEKVAELEKRLADLENNLSFVIKTNVGGEFMTDEAVANVQRIGEIHYESHGETYFLLTNDEIENLCIRKGTFTSAEFDKMQEHVVVTWEMLSQLTFPKKFANVPLYAGSHHEKLNGKGYPKHLSGDELPLPARILAVADVFEALMAADRPYKKGKTIEEAFTILGQMAKFNEIDTDLVDFLMDSGLYLDFCTKFVKPEQMVPFDKEKIKTIYHQNK